MRGMEQPACTTLMHLRGQARATTVPSYQDLVVAYSGSGKASRLESALRGPMSNMLPHEEVDVLVAWVQGGADRAKYETDGQAGAGQALHDLP